MKGSPKFRSITPPTAVNAWPTLRPEGLGTRMDVSFQRRLVKYVWTFLVGGQKYRIKNIANTEGKVNYVFVMKNPGYSAIKKFGEILKVGK